nr:Chain P, p1/p6 substrate peptide [Human immunodeficiency virus 1]
GNFLQSR